MTTTTSTSRRSSSDGALSRSVARVDGSVVHVRCTTRADGDFHRVDVPIDELESRRRAVVDRPWTMLDQRHGTVAHEVTEPGEHDGAPGDVLVTALHHVVLGCWAADCAPVVLVGRDRRIAVAHAGWRGLAAGVLQAARAALAEPVHHVVVGPTIGPCCYAFGASELVRVAAGVGADPAAISARTRTGEPALDVPAAVKAFAHDCGGAVAQLGGCTGCTAPGFSHRARRDTARHVLAVWQEPT